MLCVAMKLNNRAIAQRASLAAERPPKKNIVRRPTHSTQWLNARDKQEATSLWLILIWFVLPSCRNISSLFMCSETQINSVRPNPKMAISRRPNVTPNISFLFHFQLRVGHNVTHTPDLRWFLGPSFEFLIRADFRIFCHSYSLSGN